MVNQIIFKSHEAVKATVQTSEIKIKVCNAGKLESSED